MAADRKQIAVGRPISTVPRYRFICVVVSAAGRCNELTVHFATTSDYQQPEFVQTVDQESREYALSLKCDLN